MEDFGEAVVLEVADLVVVDFVEADLVAEWVVEDQVEDPSGELELIE